MVLIHPQSKKNEDRSMKRLLKIIQDMARERGNPGKLGPLILVAIVCLGIMTGCAADQKIKEQANIHINIGTAYIESGDYNGALKELLKAAQLDPQDPRVHYFLALAYRGKGYQEKAIEECKRAVELKDDYSEAYNLLGTIYMTKGLHDPALASFKKASENMLYDTPAVALYNMGRVYHLMGNYPKAMSHFQEAAAKDARSDLMPLIEHGMGKVSYDQHDISRAIQHFKRSIELVPSMMESHYWLGECYLQSGRAKEAKKSFETVIQLAPESEAGKRAQEKIKGITI